MRSLTTVEPHRVRVFHSVLYSWERLLVFWHEHADRTNQNSSWTRRRMRDSQASIESTRKGRARGLKRGLCHGVVLLFEDERDDIAGVGRLVNMVCPEAHDGKSYGRRTTKEGLYWMSPSGPPATTSIWAAFDFGGGVKGGVKGGVVGVKGVFLAFSWNSTSLPLCPGLIAKTMPFWQWPVC